MLSEDQIQFVADRVSAAIKKTLREALEEVSGINPAAVKNERTKARILAALERADKYIPAYPLLALVLRKKAMTKTMLRRALGGNAVNIDVALAELLDEKKLVHIPAYRESMVRLPIELFQLVTS